MDDAFFIHRCPSYFAGSGSRKWRRSQPESALDDVKKPGPAGLAFLCLLHKPFAGLLSKICNYLCWLIYGFYSDYSLLQRRAELFDELFAYVSSFLFDIFYVFARLRNLERARAATRQKWS